jgi:exodeoxyribonuclease VII large subunit
MNRAMASILRDRRFALVRVGEKMDALSPLSTLRRGYAVPLTASGKVLRARKDFRAGMPFLLRVLDGRIHAETKSVEKEEVDGDG